ncbi:non-ribosomal peptide synthetase [Williamsia sp. 1138]|nr:non-ribosomal peptide synthetase [Williamsia sp. 1138]
MKPLCAFKYGHLIFNVTDNPSAVAFSPNDYRDTDRLHNDNHGRGVVKRALSSTDMSFPYTGDDKIITTTELTELDSPVDIDHTFAMTEAQRGIWYAHQFDSEVPLSVSAYVEFRGPMDLEALAKAVHYTASETESGLLRVVETDAEPRLYVDRDLDVPLQFIDLRSESDPHERAMEFMTAHRTKPVDLQTDRLLEVFLFELGEDHRIFYCWGHHLAFDGYAAMFMMTAVGQRYGALLDGREYTPMTSATMSEISELDHAYRASEEFTSDREYWKQQLDNIDPEVAETARASLSRTETVRGTATAEDASASAIARIEYGQLSSELAATLRAVAADNGVRPASVITAAAALYLAGYTGRNQTVISLPVAARTSDLMRTSAGMTSNVLPIGVSATPQMTIAELLTHANFQIKHALKHQRFRHEDILRDLLGDNGSEREFFGPMVNVMLFFSHIDFGPVSGEVHLLSTGPVEDLSVNVYENFGSDEIMFDLEANPNRYTNDEVREHHRRLEALLESLVTSDPQTTVAHLDIVRPDERRQVLSDWNATAADFSAGTLTELLDDAAALHRDSPALVDADAAGAALTYGELSSSASALARRLIGLGVGPESVVAVMIPRSLEQVVAIHAVIKAGAAYLPINPDDPADRIEHILTTATPALALVGPGHQALPVQAVTVDVDELRATPGDPVTDADRISPLRPAHPAYVIFTSGSTGKPKGVSVSHAAIANRLQWMQAEYGLDRHDRVIQKTPATFDVSVWEFFWPLMTGAALVVPTPDGHRDPWYLRDVISRHHVTVAHFVPSMLATFVSAFESGVRPDEGTLESLRLVFTSGEALSTPTAVRFGTISSAPVHNLYGPTEAAVDVTFQNNSAASEGSSVPIGRPVANTAVYVLDQQLRPQPVGAIGELYLAGDQLARGYVQRPDLTADRFVANPHQPGRRMYRSGDLVRWRADGSLDYIGRSDFQVKIRGQRIELGEVQAALDAVTGVHEAVVIARTDAATADTMLVGYVTGSAMPDAWAIRAALRETLPEFMIPAAIVELDEIPTTSNGKLDRRALPEPQFEAAELVDQQPADDLELALCQLFSSILGRESTGAGTSFFDLGGNSLLATKVVSRLSAMVGARIGIKTLFNAPTPADLAAALREMGIDEKQIAPDRRSAIPLAPADIDRIPLSAAQQRVWFINRSDPESGAYNIPFRLKLRGELDVDALGLALRDVVERQQILRTVFPLDEQGPFQRVLSTDEVSKELTVTPVAVEPAQAERVSRDIAGEGFDLSEQIPLRVTLLQVSDDEHRLVIVLHHIAADGLSLPPLAHDISVAYAARQAGQAPEWAPLPIQYSDFSVWQQDQLTDARDADSIAAQLEYWVNTLSDIPAQTELPIDRPRPANPTMRAGGHSVTLDAGVHRGLLALSGAPGEQTMFTVVHALIATLLRRMAADDDISVGTPVGGRGDDALDQLVGMFVNTVVLRAPVSKSDTFSDLLTRLQAVTLDALAHADAPFEQVVQEVNPDRSNPAHPLFQVSIAVNENSRVTIELPGVSVDAAPIPTGLIKFDMQFTITEHLDDRGEPAGVEVEIEYASDLFDNSTIRALGKRLQRLARGILAHPTRPIGDIGILGRGEEASLVPATGPTPRRPRTLPGILAAAVEENPYAIAVRGTRDQLTYAELDARSDALAHLLIGQGIGPEDFVAVAIPRSIHWIVALWATAKTGAAWVPVDPKYPMERINHIVSDSGARLCLTISEAPVTPGDTPTMAVDHPELLERLRTASARPVTDSDRTATLTLDNPAYLIYTSGTTGTPKGVVVSHHGLVDFTTEQVQRFRVEPDSVTLHFASPSFDASVLEVLMAVGGAATMVIAPPHILGGNELQEVLADASVTHAFVTPSVLATMDPGSLPALSTVIIGGEHPNPEVVSRWARDRSLFNAYGPTEATVAATISAPIVPESALSIGGPVRGMDLLVLDERLQPVPVGAVGELYLAGGHLARGYHRRTRRTSESFLANPFGRDGDRMYRTGDLVRWTSAAELEFLGRADSQVKVRGFRIELGEIDAALVRDDLVAEAVTIARPGRDGSTELVSYVSPARAQTLQSDSLRDRLTRQLPGHMVPRIIMVIDKLPVTPSGKIDYRALPEPSRGAGDTSTDNGGSPRGRRELEVAAIFAEVIGRDAAQIGRAEDFFEMGGNSLMATQVVARLETSMGRRVPVRTLFDNPTISRLARACSSSDSEQIAPLPELVARDRPDTGLDSVPALAASRLWFLNRLEPESGAYNIAFAVGLEGDLNVQALQQALSDVTDRHEPLRTIYPEDDGKPQVRVLTAPTFDLTAREIAPTELADHQSGLAAQGFDLRSEHPIRAELAKTGDQHHVLTMVIHHIAADGWSLRPLATDLAQAYQARSGGQAPEYTPLPVRFRDFAEWQRAALGDDHDQDSRVNSLLDWWRGTLAGVRRQSMLPETFTGLNGSGTVDFSVDPAIVQRLNEVARSRDASLFMVMHSALATLLHRLSTDPAVHLEGADSDVVIGSPVAGRDHPQLAELVGMFVNTVVLRTLVPGHTSFADLVDRVRDNDIDAFSHADVPYDQLAAAVAGDRRQQDPLVRVALAFAEDGGPDLALGDLRAEVSEIDTAGTRFDLELRVTGASMRLTYARGKYRRDTVEAMAQRFTRILEAVAADPGISVDDIDILAESEWPAADVSVDEQGDAWSDNEILLPDLLADASSRNPDAVALEFEPGQWSTPGAASDQRALTYRELDEWSNRWARYLLSLEIGPEDVVPIALSRSAASVAALWAITKTGAAFVPVDPAYPAERIEHMIADCGATVGITDEVTAPDLPTGVRWISLDGQLGAAVETMSGRRLKRQRWATPDNIAYIIYTSGSTGVPKGVAVTHRGLAPLATEQRERYGIGTDSRTLHFASPSFDASILELLLAVSSGATMVIAPRIYGGTELENFLRDQRITHAFITPAALATVPGTDLPALRALAVGGEACGPELVEKWAPGRTFLNAYGPTETTVVSLMAELHTASEGTGHTVIPIGTPVRGERALLLDARLRPVPAGVPGELYLSGAGVARGYLQRAGLTATRFVASPFGDSGEVLYRTGDVVVSDPDGVITYLGRSDSQIKLRGFRIELGEINAALTARPDIRFAVTVVRGHGEGASLASYVVPEENVGGSLDLEDVRRHLQSRLPRHQVPASITSIDEVPLTPNGKLDSKALPEPAAVNRTERRPVTGDTQQSLAELFADVLGVPADQVGADDDFFELGGTSLTATQLISRINRSLGTDLPVKVVFDHPTVSDLAQFASEGDTSAGAERTPLTGAAEHVTSAPLSLAQRRLWFLASTDPESAAYNVPFAVDFHGELSVDALRSALIDLLDRHESLRTLFPEVGGEAVQVPEPDAAKVVGNRLPVEHHDDADRDELVLATAAQGFDLATQAPVRFRLLRTGPLSHTLVVVVHHIAADGWSLPTLLGDLMTAYRARIADAAPEFEPLPVSYIDHTLWQHATVGSPEDPESAAHRQLEYWQGVLQGAPTDSTIPSLTENAMGVAGAEPDRSGGNTVLTIDDDLRGAIADLARHEGVSPFMLMHAALAVLMYRMGAGSDVLIGTPVAGRFEPELQRVVGMFVNTLALRSSLDPTSSFTTLLSEIRESDLEALAHVDVPFDDVVAAVNPQRVVGRHPLFQIALSVHDWSESSLGGDLDAGPGLSAQVTEVDTPTVKFDLQFTVTGINPGADGQARIKMTYANELYDERTAEAIAGRLVRVLRAVTDTPERPIGDTPVTDFVEEATLAPVRGLPAPRPRSLAELFAAAVRDNPDGTALIDAHTSVSYREVDYRSNKLARLLLRRGLGPDSLVAMAIPRSVDSIIATLAITKTGAAFLPVDPSYPSARIEHMLSDSRVRVGITMAEHAQSLPAAVDWFVLDDSAVHGATTALSALPLTRDEIGDGIRHEQLAYIIYTSGSTGRPKGVMVSHRGLAAVHDELKAKMCPESASRVLHFASPSFDASVLEMLMAISGRAALVISPVDIYGGEQLADFLELSAVTHAFITPAALASLDHRRVRGLRTIAVGGESFGRDLVRKWSDGRTMLNVYGPTETTVITTCSNPLTPEGPITIGSPNRGVRALVLDNRLHPTPVGVAGELYLIGDQVTRGYFGRPDLTSARFVANPTGVGGERMYRTGDVVRWTAARTLQYIGRSDDQVQVRGFRIELGEIDAVLAGFDEVRHSTTIVDGDSDRQARLLSYIVTTDGVDVDTASLREQLSHKLPRHMVPSAITVLDEIPMTPVGKLDKAALPKPEVSTTTGRAPAPGTETLVAAAFATALDLETVTANDGFFDLGGNSLLATKVIATLREEAGIAVPVGWMFSDSTTEELAARIDSERHRAANEPDAAPAEPADDPALAPLLSLRATGTRHPVFAVHPALGVAWSYTSLLPHLDTDQPLYGLQNPALSGGPRLRSVPDLADFYVQQLRSVQPQGPYHLVGWSLGGSIVHEMAVQLREQGQRVDLLMLLDSYVIPGRPELNVEPSVGELLEEFGFSDVREALGHDMDADLSIEQATEIVHKAEGPLAHLSVAALESLYEAYVAATAVAREWTPRRYDGDVVFVTAAEDPPAGQPAIEDWREHVSGGIDHITAPCRHSQLLDSDHVAPVADALRRHLDALSGAHRAHDATTDKFHSADKYESARERTHHDESIR